MSEAIDIGLKWFLGAAGVGLAIALTLLLIWIVAIICVGFRDFMEAATLALRRWAMRNETVIEYYNQESMQNIRRYEDPKPDRVETARKAARP